MRRKSFTSLALLIAVGLIVSTGWVAAQPLGGGLDVSKTADPTEVPAGGGDVLYTVVVTNNTGEPIVLTGVEDNTFDISAECDPGILVNGASPTLQPGDTFDCEFERTVVGDPGTVHTNVVTAYGYIDVPQCNCCEGGGNGGGSDGGGDDGGDDGGLSCECCEAQGQTGCASSEDCTSIVCGIDSFCCATEWDSICGNIAADNCSCCGGPAGQATPVNDADDSEGTAKNASLIGTRSGPSNFQLGIPGQYCNQVPAGIPDEDPVGVTTQLVLDTDCGPIENLELTLEIAHTWVGDLQVELSNGSVSALLIDRPGYAGTGFGCSGDDIDATLADSGGPSVEDECAAAVPTIQGTFSPSPDALAVFNGESSCDTWELTVTDNAEGDLGTIFEWCLTPVTTSGPTGCDDATCQDIVCSLDSFCCDVEWDSLCDAIAADECGCCDSTEVVGFDDAEVNIEDEELLVILESFTAQTDMAGRVRLRWETLAEIDTVGFRIMRAVEGGEPVRITGVIPSEGGELSGATYNFRDGAPIPAGPVTYFLMEVDNGGYSAVVGTAEIVVSGKTIGGVGIGRPDGGSSGLRDTTGDGRGMQGGDARKQSLSGGR